MTAIKDVCLWLFRCAIMLAETLVAAVGVWLAFIVVMLLFPFALLAVVFRPLLERRKA